MLLLDPALHLAPRAVEIFIAQRQSIDALLDESPGRVLRARGIAMISEALGELLQDPRAVFHRAQQERATIGAQRAAVELVHDLATMGSLKLDVGCATLCPHNGCSWRGGTVFSINSLYHPGQPLFNTLVRNSAGTCSNSGDQERAMRGRVFVASGGNHPRRSAIA